MCGIAGFVGSGTKSDIEAMTNALIHRGPDGEGYYINSDRGIYLGHRRLAILDKQGGAQPMWDNEKSVCVIFNGEIYNHRELRQQLEKRGHRFHTDHSDTEVLVYGFKEWGDKLPLHLNGMFAFAIYDVANNSLFIARDRMGEKPLFFRQTDQGIAFASELPALISHTSFPSAEIDPVGIKKFFAHSFFPGKWTPYTGIEQLKGGHTLTIDLRSLKVRNTRYWEFHIEPFHGEITPSMENEWCEELRYLLSQAVLHRLESDVPLGIFLSGGIDSSTILAYASKHKSISEIKTFSIGFDEKSFDESEYALYMAEHIGSNHQNKICTLATAQNQLSQLYNNIGEPLGDASILPTHMLCKFVHEHVTVALSGDGGDELFAGYDPFKALAIAEKYQKLVPKSVHPIVTKLASLLPMSQQNMSLDFKINRGLRGMGFRPALWNPVWMGALAPNEISEFFSEQVDIEELYSEAIEIWDSCKSNHNIDRSLEFFTRLYLQNDILTKSDRASMQVSLEVRSPFLDNDLVDFARKLPHSVKYRNGNTKYILKKALENVLPEKVLSRRKKGFGIPLSKWLNEIPCPPNRLSFPFNTEWIDGKWKQHTSGKKDYRHAMLCWLSIQSACNTRQ